MRARLTGLLVVCTTAMPPSASLRASASETNNAACACKNRLVPN
jgi:hypothetical protein